LGGTARGGESKQKVVGMKCTATNGNYMESMAELLNPPLQFCSYLEDRIV